MKTSYIVVLGLGALVAIPVQAYTYTFNNLSDKDSEVYFQLSVDLTTGNKTQSVKVPARGINSINIPEWHRSGLCLNVDSIQIRFLPNGELKKPIMGDIRLCGNIAFDIDYDAKRDRATLTIAP